LFLSFLSYQESLHAIFFSHIHFFYRFSLPFSPQSWVKNNEEQCVQRLCLRFIRTVRGVGPLPGTIVSFQVTNKAKHNQVGRLEYTAAAPHLDPLRDTSAWHGLLWIWRFIILMEPFPDFLDYKVLFKRNRKNIG
jgi:hypothetical protein